MSRGSFDTASARNDALALYDALPRADRIYTEIADGTHFLQFEATRDVLYETVRSFHDRIGTRERLSALTSISARYPWISATRCHRRCTHREHAPGT